MGTCETFCNNSNNVCKKDRFKRYSCVIAVFDFLRSIALQDAFAVVLGRFMEISEKKEHVTKLWMSN